MALRAMITHQAIRVIPKGIPMLAAFTEIVARVQGKAVVRAGDLMAVST